jgi:hypothetical protein
MNRSAARALKGDDGADTVIPVTPIIDENIRQNQGRKACLASLELGR